MMVGHTIALNPNNKQKTYFSRASGVARFAYNWGLSEWTRQYEEYKNGTLDRAPSQVALRRQLNAIKKSAFPWMGEVTKNAPQMAIIHLGEAFRKFFAGTARYPRYKKKGLHDSFTITNDQFRVQDTHLRVPKLGWVRMREKIRFQGKILSARIFRKAEGWYVSFTIEIQHNPLSPDNKTEKIKKAENQGSVGIDMGIVRFATLSDGSFYLPLDSFRKHEKQLAKAQKALSRKQKFSQNWYKAKKRVSRIHERIANARKDFLHKTSTTISKNHAMVVLENLQVSNMSRSAHGSLENPGKNVAAKSGLNKSILDQGWYEFRRQLEYKLRWRGGCLILVPPQNTSRRCSSCGYTDKGNRPSQALFRCLSCGYEANADENAAQNILAAGKNLVAS